MDSCGGSVDRAVASTLVVAIQYPTATSLKISHFGAKEHDHGPSPDQSPPNSTISNESHQVELSGEGLVAVVAVVDAPGRVNRVPFPGFPLLCQIDRV